MNNVKPGRLQRDGIDALKGYGQVIGHGGARRLECFTDGRAPQVVELDTAAMDPARWDVQLFSQSNGRWLVEIASGQEDVFAHLMEGIPTTFLGRVGGRNLRIRGGTKTASLPLAAMRKAWTEAIPKQVVVS